MTAASPTFVCRVLTSCALILALTGCAQIKNSMTRVPSPVRDDFHGALAWNDFDKVERLIAQYPALINPGVENGESVVYAIRHSNDEIVEHIFAQGIDADGQPFIHVAAERNRTAIVTLLVTSGANVNRRAGMLKATPLHYAAFRQNADMVQELLDAGADADNRDVSGLTPLHIALLASSGELRMLGYRSEGIDVNDDEGARAALALIAAGAGLNQKTETGYTPLHLVRSQTDSSVVVALIDAGADIEAKADKGVTPIHSGAQADATSLVRELLRRGVDPNLRADHGLTPLHYAAMGNASQVISTLLEGGAELEARTDDGYTPVQYAAQLGRSEFLAAVSHATGDPNAEREWARSNSRDQPTQSSGRDPRACGLCEGSGSKMCMTCRGSGKDPSGRTLYCTACGGSGQTPCSHGR